MPKAKKRLKGFSLRSPAKLNLALRITGRRSDGFHALDTVFERISLADTIVFFPSKDEGIHITCSSSGVPCDERNLVHKAAMILRKATGVHKGACVHIQKNIPVAAGLAGGSSNAATALTGLNRLWDLKLSRAELIRLARKAGSDVAFFLYDAPLARGTGRGDRIKVLPVNYRFWHVLITAQQPLLTKDVYGIYAQKKVSFGKKTGDVAALICSLKVGDAARARELLFNDLEGSIGILRLGLLKLKARVQKAAGTGVCFSGSGPSIFALTETKAEAEHIARLFRPEFEQVFVVCTA